MNNLIILTIVLIRMTQLLQAMQKQTSMNVRVEDDGRIMSIMFVANI